jgi:hypothetical protein
MPEKDDEKPDRWLTAVNIPALANAVPQVSALEKLMAGLPSRSKLDALAGAMQHLSASEKLTPSLPSRTQLTAFTGTMPRLSALEKLTAGLPSQSQLAAFAATMPRLSALEKLTAGLPSQSQLAALAATMPRLSALEKLTAGLPSQSQLAALAATMPRLTAFEKLTTDLSCQSRLAALAATMPRLSALEKLTVGLPSQSQLAAFASLGTFGEIQHALRQYNERFYLPATSAITSLSNQFFSSEISASWRKHIGAPDALQNVLRSMTRPWADAQDSIRSVSSLAELGTLHGALSTRDPFGERISHTWRNLLGDWRDPIAPTPETIDNILSRSKFYADLGLDEKLTDFPAPAFAEAIELTSIRSKPAILLAIYGPPIADSNNEDQESAFARTNMAHDWLQRFETQLRRFIDEAMSTEFGDDWPKRHLPSNIYENWQDKKLRAEKEGAAARPLIAYADFTDYEMIICRRQNWRVFANIFHRQESIRESLQRLYLPRISTMHARLLSPEDELLLYAEIKRLARALERKDGA